LSRKSGRGRRGEVIPLQEEQRARATLEQFGKLWKEYTVVLIEHGDERFEEWGFSDADLWNVIKHGKLVKVETPICLPRYTVRGKSIDGDVVRCAFEVNESERELLIVTVFLESSRGRK